jgi:putative membrane protein
MDKQNWTKGQFIVFIKSLAMGAVNAIPGVSGGTIAMITGIFERIINSVKSFDITALKLLLKGNFREFARHTDLIFLMNVVFGNLVAIVSLARIFDVLFRDYPVYIWAYFFGLVFASVFFLGKTIKWRVKDVAFFIAGTALAVYISVATPGTENDNFWYLMLCGAIAICCKILPGTSGAFVLLLMGNYHLIMIDSINHARFDVLIPVIIGAVVGLLPFSHFLSWLLKSFRNSTTAILTGFILGSLGTLWPWKKSIIETFGTKEVITGFEWNLPQMNVEFVIAVVYCILGIATIYIIDLLAKRLITEKKA